MTNKGEDTEQEGPFKLNRKRKNKNGGCQVLSCRNGGGVTADRHRWKEETERYTKDFNQDEELRMKALKELDVKIKKTKE